MSRIYTDKELALSFSSNVLTFNDQILTFWSKGLTHFDVEGFTFTAEDMGMAQITCDLFVDPEMTPAFDRDWYMDYRGERFRLATLKPSGVKDTSSLRYKYSLIFKSQRADLERYEFANFVTASGTNQPISYDFTLPLTISEFVARFNTNLDHNFGSGVWQMVLDSSYMDNLNTAIYDGVSRITIAFSRENLWSILTGLYDIYGLRWTISSEAGVMTIRVGATPVTLSHVFEYGYDNGLIEVRRVNSNPTIYTRLSGKGSSRNLPYRYFDSSTADYIEDPDHNTYTELTPYSALMPTSYREYVKGWNDGVAEAIPDSSTYGYSHGYYDASSGGAFNPVDFVVSESAELIYGVRKGSIENNEDIYPTIQNVSVAGLGRIDQIVAVEAVLNDDYSDANTSIQTTGVKIQKHLVISGDGTWNTSTNGFSVSENSSISFSIMQSMAEAGLSMTFDSSIQAKLYNSAWELIQTKTWLRSATGEDEAFSDSSIFQDVPTGSYYIVLSVYINNTSEGDTITVTTELSQSTTEKSVPFKETVDVWIKNIWQSQYQDASHASETEDEYMHRVWDPIISPTGEMSMMFSDGLLAGEDYEFKVAVPSGTTNYYIYHDETKSYGGVNSHWRLTLMKSDAELEASGIYLPSTVINASAGDGFFFTNIEMPYDPYVYAAEQRLDEYLASELEKVDSENPTYEIKPSPIFLETFAENASIAVGAKLQLLNAKLLGEVAVPFHISNLTITYRTGKLLPEWTVVISDTPISRKNSVSILQGDIKVLSSSIRSASQTAEQVQLALDSRYLRKDGPDMASLSPTTFNRKMTAGAGISSPDFVQGQVAGSGFSVYKDVNENYVLEIDKLNIRKTFYATELVINQVSIYGGIHIYSAAAMTVSDVDTTDSSVWKCYLDIKQGTVLNQFVVGDRAFCQRYSPLSATTVIKYYWKEVTEVGPDYICISRTGGDGDGVPAVGDNISQLGNASDITRQSALIIDQTNGGSVTQYAKIDGFTLSGKDYVAYGVNPSTGVAYERIYGDFYAGGRTPATDNYFSFDSSTGEIRYRGTITQDSIVEDAGGNTSPITVDRGPWDASTVYYVGNTVFYSPTGSTYYCDVQTTAGIIPTNAGYWHVYASKGETGTNAKAITLYATSQMILETELGVRSPVNISVVGITQNTSISAWAYSVNGGAFSSSAPTGVSRTGDTVVITSADVTFNTLSVRATDGTVTDTLSIALAEDGDSAINVVLTNESHTVAADSSGNLYSGELTEAFTFVKAFRGGTELTIGNDFSIDDVVASSGLTFSWDGVAVQLESMSSAVDSGYADITIANSTWSVVKRFSIAKSKTGLTGPDGKSLAIKGSVETMDDLPLDASIGDGYIVTNDGAYTGHLYMWDGATWVDCGQVKGDTGAAGLNAKLITLSASSLIIAEDQDGGRTPATITINAAVQNTDVSIWSYSVDGGGFSGTPPTGVARVGHTVIITVATVTFETLSVRASDGTVTDTVTVSRIVDGSDAFMMVLSNQAHVIQCANDGSYTPGALDLAYTEARIYRGAQLVDLTDSSISVNSSGMICSGVTSQYYVTASADSISADNAYADIIIDIDGLGEKILSQRFSVAKSRAGENGSTGASAITIYCENQNLSVVPTVNAFTKAITIRLLSGGTPIPVESWSGKSKTLIGLTAGADSWSGNDYIINLTGFSNSSTGVGYVNVSIGYGGQTYQMSISVVRNSTPVYIQRGVYVAGTSYYGSYVQRDEVKYTDGNWYAALPTIGNSSTNWVASEWELLNSFKNIATETLLTPNANIAGFVYKDEQMISQSGTIGGNPSTNWANPGFVPNLKLNGSTGEIVANDAVIRGDIYAAGNKFKALEDGTFEVEFSTDIDRYDSSGNTETITQTVTIDNTTGNIETRTSDNETVRLTSQGVFANKAGTQALPSTSGVELKASVVGLGQGDLAKSAYGGLAAICGVFGTASNENANPAPFFGGYFRKLKAAGLYLGTHAANADYVCSDYVVFVSCYNTGPITISLPLDPYPGRIVYIRRNNSSDVTISGNGELIKLPDGSNVASNDMYSRGNVYMMLFDGYYWLLNNI